MTVVAVPGLGCRLGFCPGAGWDVTYTLGRSHRGPHHDLSAAAWPRAPDAVSAAPSQPVDASSVCLMVDCSTLLSFFF